LGRCAVTSQGTEDETAPSGVDELVERARASYSRVRAYEAATLHADGGLLVDIRPAAQRSEFGGVPGALVIERNVLEWRLDPTSPHRHSALTGPDQHVVVICQAGYASSLAAASLRQLGLTNATDLVGGFEAWAQAGLPVVGPSTEVTGCLGDGSEVLDLL
jgi:rhodanese-related sulfurtransferase